MEQSKRAQWQAAALNIARKQIEGYAFTIDTEGRFVGPSGQLTLIKLVFRRDRFEARSCDKNTLMWNGGNVEDFIRRFWFAEKIDTRKE